MSEGTSPSSSSDEGSRSTPSNLPKAATRARKKRTSDSEDEDYVAKEDEAISRKVLKKEYGTGAATKPGLNRKDPAKRTPMLKVRGSTQETEISEPKEPEVTEKKRKERDKKTMARVVGKPSMMEEEEEEAAAPAPKAQKLMGDAIRSGVLRQSPKKHPRQLLQSLKLHPRGILGAFLLERRTRPQCLKLLVKRKKMKSMS